MFWDIIVAFVVTSFICLIDLSDLSLDKRTEKLLYINHDEKESISNSESNNQTSIDEQAASVQAETTQSKATECKDDTAKSSEDEKESVNDSSVQVNDLTDDFIEGVYDEFT